MKLMTKEIIKRFETIGSQEGKGKDATVIAKFFTPDANWTWLATEAEIHEEDTIFFGLVKGLETEWGYFALSQLTNTRGPMGLPIERDMYISKDAKVSDFIK